MRLLVLLLLLLPGFAVGQSKTVLPSELSLSVRIEDTGSTPYEQEMILLTIEGIYRRHITLEKLKQPDFEGFNWAQLGPDYWRDDRIDGKKVKILTRRMAIYPDRAGEITIAPFVHELTLTDENDDWFPHEIQSDPVTVTVAPLPASAGDWWFPVKQLKIADNWSNAPDQLTPGEGVLRIVRIEALGATPEMIPPMPDLTSPSAMIFPHPEKRLIELTPDGPVTFAFWRWTIRPSNDTSTIVEPLTFSYFNTETRQTQEVTVSAQRVAFGDLTPTPPPTSPAVLEQTKLPSWPMALLGLTVFGLGSGFAIRGRQVLGLEALQRFPLFDPIVRRMRRAAHSGDVSRLRRAAMDMIARDGMTLRRQEMLSRLDRSIFAAGADKPELQSFADAFRKL